MTVVCSKTAFVCALSTLVCSQFMSYHQAFIMGAFITLFPLRMTVLPGKMPSETGMVASASVILAQMLGFSLWHAFLFGWLVGPITYWLLLFGIVFNTPEDNTQYQWTKNPC